MADVTDPLRETVYRPGREVSVWPYVKVQRASQHLTELQARVAIWLATQPFTTVGKIADDRQSWSLRLQVYSPPPTQEWAVYLGDSVHNLRSALDAAVWEMCTRDGATPARPLDIQFPFVQNPDKWDDAVRRRLAGAPSAAIERIKIVQPMMRTHAERSRDPLLLLQHLSNLDKHKSSIKASLVPDSLNADFQIDFGSHEAATRNDPPDLRVYFPEIRDGELLVEYVTRTEIKGTSGGFGVGIGFAVDTPAGNQKLFETMSVLVNYVGQVLTVLHGGAEKIPRPPDAGAPDEDWRDLEINVNGVSDDRPIPPGVS